MRVLQLIDSLEAGGAERMAINYANALEKKFGFSALVSTRSEGFLKEQLDPKVHYLHLKKKNTLDFVAVFRLKKFIKSHKIEIIQAHSSSYFTAILVWILCKNLKIIWHDHYGNSEFLSERKVSFIRFFSRFFYAIISVNKNLEQWANEKLHCKNVVYLPNFVFFEDSSSKNFKLKGKSGKRILLLANLRPQKNHEMLLEIAKKITSKFPDWTFHLVGKDFEDSYSEKIKREISSENLANNVFLYGSQDAISDIIKQCSIGVLTSDSEGLPVAILEYGFFGLPVISTNVGEIGSVISNNSNGFLVAPNDSAGFSEKLMLLLENEDKRLAFATNLQKTIFDNYTHEAVIEKYQKYIERLS